MWPFGKSSARRKEIRRSKAERRTPWWQRIVGGPRLWVLISAAVVSLGAALILNAGPDVLDLRESQHLPRAITARLDFRIEDKAQTRAMQVQARDRAPNYYRLDTSLLDDLRGRLTSALKLANEHAADPPKLREEAAKIMIRLDEEGLAELTRVASLPDPTEFQQAVDSAIRILAAQPLVEPTELAGRRTAVEAVLVDPSRTRDRSVPVAQLLFSNNPEVVDPLAETASAAFGRPLRASMRDSLVDMLRGATREAPVKPIYRYDSERSAQVAQEAFDHVPPQYVTYAHGVVLADAGIVTADEVKLLREEHAQYLALVRGPPPPPPPPTAPDAEHEAYDRLLDERAAAQAAHRWEIVGRSVLTFCVVFGVAGYIRRYQPTAVTSPMRQGLALLVLLLVLGVTRAAYGTGVAAHLTVGAQAFAAGLLTIVFPQAVVVAVCGALAVLITLGTQQSISFLVVLLAVSGTLVLGLRDVRNRGKIVAVAGLTALVALVTTIAAGLIDRQTLSFVLWQQASWAVATTLAAGFLVEGILPGIERLFGLSTSMTLLEWCDASKPLLRMMAADAPGTYNHSLLVGALAESAAEAIEANGLLARTGAYYHDVGKINKPEYFVENQALGVSRHERLSPAMSLLIIIGHVKDGIEMAKEYKLPANLHAFIAEHHGTTLIEYFYHAANQARRPGDPEVSDTVFRYPGPKPHSRETAIVMLCDGVEGAVRAMAEPTPGRIEAVVSEIVRKRLMDGQLDECDLTFRELEIIERSLVKSLCSIYHARIAYPAADERRPAETRAS